jgi:hypothetical protein
MEPTVNPISTATLPFEAALQHLKGALLKRYEDESRRLDYLLPMVRFPRPHVLLIGPAPRANRMIERLRPYLRTPITSWAPRERREPPTSAGTLVIRGVEALNATQQERVLALNERRPRELQIVSIARAPVLPWVERGVFLDRLYYQLNVVYLDLNASI